MKYFGNIINKENNIITTKMNFKLLNDIYKIRKLFEKPLFQGSLCDDKVKSMIQYYLLDNKLWGISNRIPIAVIADKFFVIDGQHRLESACILYNEHKKNWKIQINWIEIKKKEELRKFFEFLNKDSIKNQYYIKSSNFVKIKLEDFTKYFKNNFKKYFSNKIGKRTKLKTIESFRKELQDKKYFDMFENINDAIGNILKKNIEFYNIFPFDILLNHSKDKFFKMDLKCLKDKIVYTSKQNNFIDFLIKNSKPTHSLKKEKIKISKRIKAIVWNKYYNNIKKTNCPIKYCANKIEINKFDCGHIISEFNKGQTIVSNMKPICKDCNCSMSILNWDDYEKILN